MSDSKKENEDSISSKQYHFRPDSAMKMLLKEISTPRLIGIVNALCNTNYPENSTVDFGNTEHFKLLGDLGKNLVRGDFVATIQPENADQNPEKIVLEFQSTSDKNMGFRLMVYTFNEAVKDEKAETYVTAKGSTIYTTTDLPPKGNDEVNLKIGHFRVGETEYSGDDGDILTLLFPFINVLEMKLEEFENSPLELLKVVYPYRYRKNPELMKKTDELQRVMENVRDFTFSETGHDRMVINQLVADILKDLMEICKKKNFEKELNIMETSYKSYHGVMMEEMAAEVEARAEKRSKLEIAKNFLKDFDNESLSKKIGLPISEIEKLRLST